jgi:cytochrome c biogenesis protein ResB
VRSPLKSLRSLKLTFALLCFLLVSGILASLLPQGNEASYYYSTLPPFLAGLAVKTGFSDFYRSFLFLIPALLFFANLSACAADRLVREFKKERAKRRHGPDILHLGLILLILSAVFSQAAKLSRPDSQGFVRLGKGEAVELPDGRLLAVLDLRADRYADGRPKDWVSRVEVRKDGKILVPSYEIRVNHPLRLGSLSIFQSSYGSERVLVLSGPSGVNRSLAAGESIETESKRIVLMSVDSATGTAVAREEPLVPAPKAAEASETRLIRLTKGSMMGPFTIAGTDELALSGLMASYDPAFPAILASLLISALGIFITFARKFGEKHE